MFKHKKKMKNYVGKIRIKETSASGKIILLAKLINLFKTRNDSIKHENQ
jgi:hypothetical protein